jgi:hypothetical protein
MHPNIELIDAACKGDLHSLENALFSGADDYNEALRWASGCGRLDAAVLLLEKGATDYSRALELAVRGGRAKMVKILLEKGADANAVDKNGVTPLCNAVRRGNYEVIKLLLENGASGYAEAVSEAIEQKNIAIVGLLIVCRYMRYNEQ